MITLRGPRLAARLARTRHSTLPTAARSTAAQAEVLMRYR
jgi:hypothetical protein